MTRWLLYPTKFEPIIAPANPSAPTQWFSPLSEPRKIVIAAAVLAASGCTLPPQPPVAAPVAPAFGWFTPLSQTLFKAQAARNFPAQFGYQFFYGVPAAPPAAPPMAFYRPLSEPVRAKIRYPAIQFGYPAWTFGAISSSPIWTPQVPVTTGWNAQAPSSDDWVPQVADTTTWTEQ